MKNNGMFWHEYHSGLLSWCNSYWQRIREIIRFKSKGEWYTRTRRFRKVKGELPQELIDAANFRTNGRCSGLNPPLISFFDLRNKHKDLIEALHKEECPNCPWDGYTIFPETK